MRRTRLTAIGSAALVFACGAPALPPQPENTITEASKKPADPPPAKVTTCASPVNVADLFARHAAAYGSERDVAATFPITLSGSAKASGKTGAYQASLDAKHHRSSLHLPGIEQSDGIDDTGAWQIGSSGSFFRLRDDETRATDVWVLRRGYASAFDPARDAAHCGNDDGKTVVVEEKIDALGNPKLIFDADTAALLSVEHATVDGGIVAVDYSWSARTGSVPSWPSQWVSRSASSSIITTTIARTSVATADDFSPPSAPLTFDWGNAKTVRVPMKFYAHEIMIDITISGKKAQALLDSGAGISVVEASSDVATTFTPELELDGQGLTQTITFGLGKEADVRIGALRLKNLPTARVPIPGFDQFGPHRPAFVLGWSLFETSAVRIDYAKNEVVFAKASDALRGVNATAIPIRDLDGKVVTDAGLGVGSAAVHDAFELDTGNSAGFSLYAGWGKSHGFPGSRPSVAISGQFGAGIAVSTWSDFRETTDLGPIHAPSDLVDVSESAPEDGSIAGLIGNVTFAKCDAITFDVPNRKVWLEGACARAVPISHTWWTLVRKDSTDDPKHPWIVASTAPKGSADLAGVQVGDRILAIDGASVGLKYELVSLGKRAIGAKVALTVLRGTETKKLEMKLIDPI